MTIELGTSDGSPVLLDVDALLATRMLIQASSGGGKSYTIRRIAEQAFGLVQIVIIDPEGEFATLREHHGYVLVGKGGEAAADPRSAELLARRLLELNASAVCDISELKMPDRHAWVARFLTGLMEAPRELWHPLIVVVDEAHMYCPEKGQGESEAASAMMDLAARGRKRGFCPIFATQRLAKLAKNATAELQNVLIGRTVQDVDLKRAADALGYAPAAARELSGDLKLLESGCFYALGRALGPDVIKLKVGPVATKLPPSGGARSFAAPPAPAAIRSLLPKLADLPKEAEDSQRSDRKLLQRIAELEQQLQRPAVDPEIVSALRQHLAQAEERFTVLVHAISEPLAALNEALGSASAETMRQSISGGSQQAAPECVTETSHPAPPPRTRGSGDVKSMGKCERAILTVLAQHGRSSKTKIAACSGYSVGGGGFNNAVSACRTRGWLAGADPLNITDEGLTALGNWQPLPSGRALLQHWLGRLGKCEREILSALYKQGQLHKADLAETTGYAASGGGFNNAISALRTLTLVEGSSTLALASDFRKAVGR